MATQVQRKITPTTSLRLAQSTGNQRFLLKPALPERSASRPVPVPPTTHCRLEHSASLPTIPSSKVRFSDMAAPNRPPRWMFEKCADGKVKTTSPVMPPPQNIQTKENELEAGESSKTPLPNPKIRQNTTPKLGLDTKAVASNPFADPDSAIDLPDLMSDDDPFRDGHSVSSTSTLSANDSETTRPTPMVRIVEYNATLLTPAASPLPEADFKEDQAFFIGLEQFNHPDIARGQFRCKRGMLWEGAINILMKSYLHPLDLTE